jgi:natural product precursor
VKEYQQLIKQKMKKIKFEKKLSLKKEKIASLNEMQMNEVKGGETNSVGCPTTVTRQQSVCILCGGASQGPVCL